jgi:alpha-2-macroglobulin
VKLEPSLAATTLGALDYFENYENSSIEGVVSRFLPNLYTHQALENLGYGDPALQANLEREINFALQRLYAEQKADGGWGWFIQDESNPLVTTYALMGLVAARDAGYAVSDGVIRNAINYLNNQIVAVNNSVPTWRLNRQAYMLAVLAYAGEPNVAATSNLYDASERLDNYAKALLAWGLMNGGNETRANNLLDNVLGDAITSANGTHWEEDQRDYHNWNSNTRTTAIVLDMLVVMRPDSDIIPSIVRWLITARQGDAWETSQETAWAVMALTDWFRATGELNADYRYSVKLNDDTLTEREVGGFQAQGAEASVLQSQTLVTEVSDLLQVQANQLTIERSDGAGVLYYTAYLNAVLPVAELQAQDNGIFVRRYYTLPDSDEPITEARVGQVVEAHLTVVVPNDMYYVVVEDPLPAGAEGIDPNLRTSQQIGTQAGIESDDPLSFGWGWWWFSNITFHDEKVIFNATYLPAGTYNYIYTMRPSVEGTYNVIPPTAREFYFPEVYGRGDGSTFTVLPAQE